MPACSFRIIFSAVAAESAAFAMSNVCKRQTHHVVFALVVVARDAVPRE